MVKQAEIESKFWKSLGSDRVAMLGLSGAEEEHGQPMAVQMLDDAPRGRLWFFTTKDSHLVRALGQGHRAALTFAAKGHDVFATVHGQLVPDNDRATIDRLWNRFVAAWYEGGKDDPQLQLLRLDGERAQIWLNENSLFAGIKLLLGSDPKEMYKDKIADVALHS